MRLLPHTRSFHSWRRRQQVTPEQQPISWGSISQGMQLFSTNNMPMSAARSSTRGCRLWAWRLLGQQRLDDFPKFARDEFFSHIFTLPATRFC